jgi:hypothetical protein
VITKENRVSHLSITYYFKLPDNTEKVFPLVFDKNSLELRGNIPDDLPYWAKIEHHQCPHCPLSSATLPICPLAARLVPVVEAFQEIISHDTLSLVVTTAERTVSQNTTAQRALCSLLGILFAGSGCPHTSYFKPMARFHLPLASEAETIYRSTSMYMMAQFFRYQQTGQYDFSLKGLEEIYTNMQIVNSSLVNRLRHTSKSDSYVNAIVMLDMFARTVPFVIEESLEEIRYLFASYLNETDQAG